MNREEPEPLPAKVESTSGCLAGLDEAGLGPVLGPLVVGGVAMTGAKGMDPWQALVTRVCRDGFVKGRIRVADSKKVHQGARGFARLEETVLTFYGAFRGGIPGTLQQWLEELGVDLGRLQICPWYRDLTLPLPHRINARELELGSHLLRRAMDENGITLTEMAVRVMDAEEFNESIERTDNKSRTHFEAYADVLATLLRGVPDQAHVVADRCGGISHYLPGLKRCWPSAQVQVLEEGPVASRYRIRTRRGEVQVTFTVGGEARAFPTALSSCLAKYLRELLVLKINQWFCTRMSGLRPTAGYYVDGQRFLTDVAGVLDREAIPTRILTRCR